MVGARFVDLMVFLVGIHELVEILGDDALELGIVKTSVKIVL